MLLVLGSNPWTLDLFPVPWMSWLLATQFFLFALRTLLGASPLLELNIKVSSNILGWLLCIPILSLIITGLLAMLRQGRKGSVHLVAVIGLVPRRYY